MVKALSRKNANRKSMLRNLATSLILYEKITTTTAKAKEVKSIVEKEIYKSKQNKLIDKRKLLGYLFDENAVIKMYEDIAPRYKNIKTGIIKSYKIKNRKGDGAELTQLVLTKIKVEESQNEKTKDKNN